MGNCTSYRDVVPQTAILIDAHGNRRQIKVPVMAAEIMLDDPGHVVSPVMQIRRDRRITAMKADEQLSAGKVYFLVPASRAHSKVSESDMDIIDSACEKSVTKRRSSKVLPTETEEAGDKVEGSLTFLQADGTGFTGQKLGILRQWQPALEPIFEGI